ncbi:MAG TPA: phosphoribosyltransferase family protein [Vicinamibacterales bacterium]|nr:phosphoribosyltransferase family protein [Vicinamibacterales bacterium]
MNRREEIRAKALHELQQLEVLMLDGHFDYGNGFHGRVYINPHALFRHPSTIWRFAQDLLDLLPADVLQATEVVAGPATGGALLAHTIAGLLDSRRSLTHPPTSFAPIHHERDDFSLRPFYAREINGRRVLLADDVRNTGQTLARCAELVADAGGTPIATVQIYDRLESHVDLGVPNFALAEYKAPDNFAAGDCPLCEAHVPITKF